MGFFIDVWFNYVIICLEKEDELNLVSMVKNNNYIIIVITNTGIRQFQALVISIAHRWVV